LTSEDAFLCFRNGKPAAAVDFGNLNPVLGPWGPFDLTQMLRIPRESISITFYSKLCLGKLNVDDT
jgi:hypothetical protein